MITKTFETKEEWLNARRGKITGTVPLVPRRGKKPKVGFYEILAERLSVPDDTEDGMERGNALEQEALDRFAEETGKEVDSSLVMWVREDNENLAVSPDGVISETEAVEAKCLASKNHIKVWVEQELENDHYDQAIQYFIVNDDLQTLHFAFYDPRIPAKDFFVIEINRADIAEDIEKYREFEVEFLGRIDDIVNDLTF